MGLDQDPPTNETALAAEGVEEAIAEETFFTVRRGVKGDGVKACLVESNHSRMAVVVSDGMFDVLASKVPNFESVTPFDSGHGVGNACWLGHQFV